MILRILTLSSLVLAGCLGEREPAAPDAGAPDVPAVADLGPMAPDVATVDLGPPPPPPSDLLDDGEACVASAECTSGRCAMPCEGYGVCAPAFCTKDDDCLVDGTEATLCCEGGTCAPIAGAVCGDRKGKQGATCGASGQSACAEGFRCLDACQPTSYCAAACDGDAVCEAVDPALGCWTVSGLGKRCVVDPEKPLLCQKTSECGGGNICTANISWDGTSVITMCQPKSGTKPVGGKCAQGTDCAGGFCFEGLCTAACVADMDCACNGASSCTDQVCLDVWFELSGGKSDAARLCYPRVRCVSTLDCDTLECTAYAEEDGWSSVCQKPAAGASPAGSACSDHQDCASGACHAGKCRALCGPPVVKCGALEECLPTALDGKGQLGLCL